MVDVSIHSTFTLYRISKNKMISSSSCVLNRVLDYTDICSIDTALYEADKRAHEEAVQNGGVSTIDRLVLLRQGKVAFS